MKGKMPDDYHMAANGGCYETSFNIFKKISLMIQRYTVR